MVRVLISTGEVSGDLQGSLLVEALQRQAASRDLPLEVLALGGPRMQAAGAELLADTAPLGSIGLWEALPLVVPTLQMQAKVKRELTVRPPDVVVLIDYMGANVRLGQRLRRDLPQVPINYYIAPQEWAWRMNDGGTSSLLEFTDRILAIFPEEASFYAAHGAEVTWVGHPLLDLTADQLPRDEARRQLGLAPEGQLLLLLPASRPQELRYLMPVLAEVAAQLQARDPELSVIVPAGLRRFEQPLAQALEVAGVRGQVIPAAEADALKPALFGAADLALGKSGTVNLELALHGVPQVVGYRVSRLTAWVARHLLRFEVDHISPVNLLLKERLVPELLQDTFTVDDFLAHAIPLLEDAACRARVEDGYRRLRQTLGSPGVTDRAAVIILDSIPQ
ncbi:MAG: lipid-A-disaccharide synthase [Synechococcus sp.]|nr:lipid-A-disaccharide synthase [Synechococcus sp.]